MKRYPILIRKIERLTSTSFSLVVVPVRDKRFFEFLPGQYATIQFPTHDRLKGERSFSVASGAHERSHLEFGIRVSGKYTNALSQLRVGERGYISGPFGNFVFDPIRDRSAVFIAGGIGITPFLSMIRTATARRWPNTLTLIYSVKSVEDAPFAAELHALEQQNPNLHIFYAVSDKKIATQTPQVFPGRVSTEILAAALGGTDAAGQAIFLCGPPPFMKSITRLLKSHGIAPNDIMTERFSVGSSALIESHTPVPRYVFAAWGVAAAIVFGMIVRSEKERRAAALSAAEASTQTTEQPVITTPSPTNTTTQTSTNTPTVTPTPTTTTTTPVPTVTPRPTITTTPTPTVTPTPRVVPRTRIS